MSRAFLFVTLLAACTHAPRSETAPIVDAPAPAPAASIDVALATPPPDAWEHENAESSGASARDRAVLDALVGAFPDAGWNAVGGREMFHATLVSCDRAAATCTATSTEEATGSPGQRLAANGQAARAVISALETLDQSYRADGTVQARCDARGCRVAEIACYSDRHDELGAGGANLDIHRTNTCQDSRIPVPMRLDKPEPPGTY